MRKDQAFIDAEGKAWITPARAAEIWNERIQLERGTEGRYTRWSVHQRRDKLTTLETPLGKLYSEEDIRKINLSPHPERPDVTKRNRERKKKTEE